MVFEDLVIFQRKKRVPRSLGGAYVVIHEWSGPLRGALWCAVARILSKQKGRDHGRSRMLGSVRQLLGAG